MEQIQTNVDGTLVTGEITLRQSRAIKVQITSPFTGLSNARYIPLFASGEASYEGEFGMQTAMDILEDLYHLGLEALSKKEVLKKALAELEASQTSLDQRILELESLKQEKHSLMKKGLITSKEYQQSVFPHTREIKSCNSQKDDLFRVHIAPCFDRIITADSEPVMIEFIRQMSMK